MKKIGLVLLALTISMALPTMNAEATLLMSGSTNFSHTLFAATVYWQVYSPFDASSPLNSISDYGYFYQVHNSGTGDQKAITQFGVDNPLNLLTDSRGYLTTSNLDSLSGSVAPTSSMSDMDSSALWTFTSPTIPLGSDSYLLYFTSPYGPGMVTGGVEAGAHNNEGSVPGPVPEPASLALLSIGLVGFVGGVIRKKFMA